jgi:hypothetical protein
LLEDDDAFPLQLFCMVCVVFAAIALGMRIEGGIF